MLVASVLPAPVKQNYFRQCALTDLGHYKYLQRCACGFGQWTVICGKGLADVSASCIVASCCTVG